LYPYIIIEALIACGILPSGQIALPRLNRDGWSGKVIRRGSVHNRAQCFDITAHSGADALPELKGQKAAERTLDRQLDGQHLGIAGGGFDETQHGRVEILISWTILFILPP